MKNRILRHGLLFLQILGLNCVTSSPNIVFVLMDDVGWADFGYNTNGLSAIPTPNLDLLANQGLKLKNHYVHSTCTPSRASLMTGRYSANVGLPCAMAPGSVAGLPDNVKTMPQVLRDAGYSAHMVGKWHIGHSQWKQTPVGKGFESHVGSYMWGMEHHSKILWRDMWNPISVDWGKYYENGTYEHYAENRHSTVAITDEALDRMNEHDNSKPLFLYVSFTAAHTPLQPDSKWLSQCQHIPHLWRKNYCGLIVGMDLAVKQLVEGAKEHLGDDTVIVVTSDNGGPPWFGANNAPFRGTKLTPLEGGVKVPGFVLDFSGSYSMVNGTEMTQLMHISDWMPTFLSWAGAENTLKDLPLDGKDQSRALLKNEEVRQDILLELFTEKESHDRSYSAAYRKGKYKLIQGRIGNPHWYYEPIKDMMNSTDTSWLAYFVELFMKWMERIYGTGPINFLGTLVVNNIMYYNNKYHDDNQEFNRLFDLEEDPEEKFNVAKDHPDIVVEFSNHLENLKKKRPRHQKYWFVSKSWVNGAGKVPGNCSGSLVKSEHCQFTHPWIPDTTDVLDEENLDLISGFQWWFTGVLHDNWHRLLWFMLVTMSVPILMCKILF